MRCLLFAATRGSITCRPTGSADLLFAPGWTASAIGSGLLLAGALLAFLATPRPNVWAGKGGL